MILKRETHRGRAWWVGFRAFKLGVDQLIFPRSTEAAAAFVMGMLIRRSGLIVINVIPLSTAGCVRIGRIGRGERI